MFSICLVFAIFGLFTTDITRAQAQIEEASVESKHTSASEQADPRGQRDHQNLRGDILHIDDFQEPEWAAPTNRQLLYEQCRAVTGSSSLTVYAGPCSSFPTLGSLTQNSNAYYTGWKNIGPSCTDGIAWAMVQWPANGSGVGYIASNYLAYCTTSSSSCRKVTAANVAVRSGPCTTFPSIGTVSTNYQVTYKNWKVTNQPACTSGIYWAQIRYRNGSTGIGYVDSSKLSMSSCDCSYSTSTFSNAQPIIDFFKGQGITDKKALAVILGNLQQESSLNPLACESIGGPAPSLTSCTPTKTSSGYWRTGVGILQWSNPNNVSGRRDQLFAYCNSKGLDVNALSSQLQFLITEWDWTKSDGAQKCFVTAGKQMGSAPDNYKLATPNSYWYCAAYWTRWGSVGCRVTYASNWLNVL
jgi:hypothetical protein